MNVTLGLPFVRTSVDHGTGFDIVEKGVAEEASLLAAMSLAARAGLGRPPRAAHGLARVALDVLALDRLALVVRLLAAREADLELHAAVP